MWHCSINWHPLLSWKLFFSCILSLKADYYWLFYAQRGKYWHRKIRLCCQTSDVCESVKCQELERLYKHILRCRNNLDHKTLGAVGIEMISTRLGLEMLTWPSCAGWSTSTHFISTVSLSAFTVFRNSRYWLVDSYIICRNYLWSSPRRDTHWSPRSHFSCWDKYYWISSSLQV